MGVVQVTSNQNNLTMKFFVLLAAIGAASAASSNAVTCEECQQGAAALVDHLLTSESLDEQAGFIKALVCPEAAVDMWFADMATWIYNHFVIDGDVCSRLGLCKKASIFPPRDWTCEECTDILARTADYMSDPATIDE